MDKPNEGKNLWHNKNNVSGGGIVSNEITLELSY